MAIKDLMFLGNEVLRQKCAPVTFPLSKDSLELLKDLNDTVLDFKKTHDFGRGIAAPQIGVLAQVVCINTNKPQYFINPQITEYSSDTFFMYDDCFSMPEIMVYIERSKAIKVKFYDENGQLHEKCFSGDMSELLQHEIDHLNGVMAIDRVKSLKDIYSRSEWKNKQNS